MTVSAYIGLGANLGDPRAQVMRALDELAHIPNSKLTRRSSLWRTAPIGYTDQPEYINAVAKLETRLSADSLLDELQALESSHARERSFANAPRTLDLDLLLYGEEVRHTARLTLPHPRMHERAFVLKPLIEVEPDIIVPGRGPAVDCLAPVSGQACERIG